MLSFWEGHVLLQSHQLRKGHLAGRRSSAAPARTVPKVAELLNQAKDAGGTYDLGMLAQGTWS